MSTANHCCRYNTSIKDLRSTGIVCTRQESFNQFFTTSPPMTLCNWTSMLLTTNNHLDMAKIDPPIWPRYLEWRPEDVQSQGLHSWAHSHLNYNFNTNQQLQLTGYGTSCKWSGLVVRAQWNQTAGSLPKRKGWLMQGWWSASYVNGAGDVRRPGGTLDGFHPRMNRVRSGDPGRLTLIVALC